LRANGASNRSHFLMRKIAFGIAALAVVLLGMEIKSGMSAGAPQLTPPDGGETVASRLAQVGDKARNRWEPYFECAGLSFPPAKTLLVGFKAERRLEIYAASEGNTWRFVRAMPIEKASGVFGPKLRMGDGQVPEGFYRVESLNPNSKYHLSLRVSYPSDEDKDQARLDGRSGENLGGDIMIHGGAQSVGCLAMGDEGAEDLFVLAARTVHAPIEVWLCPLDFRAQDVPADASRPHWVASRYLRLSKALRTLPPKSAN